MIPPMYKEKYENLTLKELVVERQKLIKQMQEYEDEYILEKYKDRAIIDIDDIIIEDPAPDVIWSVNNCNLIMLTNLIEEKRKKII